MRSFVNDQFGADNLVKAFFDQRRYDNDLDIFSHDHSPWHPSEDDVRWDQLFSQLFNACEDLDTSPDNGEEVPSHWIDEPTFRKRIELLLPQFEAFEF